LPLPVPLAPTVIVSHESLLTAVQLHVALAVTVTFPLTAIDDVRFEDAGAIVTRHGTPACVTVKLWPAIVTVPIRVVVSVLAVTL